MHRHNVHVRYLSIAFCVRFYVLAFFGFCFWVFVFFFFFFSRLFVSLSGGPADPSATAAAGGASGARAGVRAASGKGKKR